MGPSLVTHYQSYGEVTGQRLRVRIAQLTSARKDCAKPTLSTYKGQTASRVAHIQHTTDVTDMTRRCCIPRAPLATHSMFFTASTIRQIVGTSGRCCNNLKCAVNQTNDSGVSRLEPFLVYTSYCKLFAIMTFYSCGYMGVANWIAQRESGNELVFSLLVG